MFRKKCHNRRIRLFAKQTQSRPTILAIILYISADSVKWDTSKTRPDIQYNRLGIVAERIKI